jgi:hypothetical protein
MISLLTLLKIDDLTILGELIMTSEPEVVTKLTDVMSFISENYENNNSLDLESQDLLNELILFFNNNVSNDDLELIKKKILELNKNDFYLWFMENKNTVKNIILDM